MSFDSVRQGFAHPGSAPTSGQTVGPGGFHSWPADGSVRAALRAAASPKIDRWTRPDEHDFDNRDWTHDCQGLTTDGEHWFVSSNNADYRGIYKFTSNFSLLGKASVPGRLGSHIGDIDHYRGRIYAPIETEERVAVFDTSPALVEEGRLTDDGGPAPHGHFPWCAINPWNGHLYTSDYDDVDRVYAYDVAAGYDLVDSLPLGGATLDKVQGGTFSSTGKLYLSSAESNDIRAYSALDGRYFGRRSIDVDGFDQEKVEGVAVWPITVDGSPAQVHLVLLDIDVVSKHDIILKHFAAPDPALV